MNTILVIEDSAVESAIISECLQRGGLHVVTVTTAEDGLTFLAKRKPDLIVLDVVLPGLSGFELCRELKGESATKAIPIVICSTKNSDTDKFWGRAQGADAYISKPINQTELVQTVKDLLTLQASKG